MEPQQPDFPGANLETGGLDRGAAIMTGRCLAVVPLFLSMQIVGPSAAKDVVFDLTIDFDALHYDSSDPMADNPPRVCRLAGHPDRPGDDSSNKTIGIELRRRF